MPVSDGWPGVIRGAARGLGGDRHWESNHVSAKGGRTAVLRSRHPGVGTAVREDAAGGVDRCQGSYWPRRSGGGFVHRAAPGQCLWSTATLPGGYRGPDRFGARAHLTSGWGAWRARMAVRRVATAVRHVGASRPCGRPFCTDPRAGSSRTSWSARDWTVCRPASSCGTGFPPGLTASGMPWHPILRTQTGLS
jgi:hypothetical protein